MSNYNSSNPYPPNSQHRLFCSTQNRHQQSYLNSTTPKHPEDNHYVNGMSPQTPERRRGKAYVQWIRTPHSRNSPNDHRPAPRPNISRQPAQGVTERFPLLRLESRSQNHPMHPTIMIHPSPYPGDICTAALIRPSTLPIPNLGDLSRSPSKI